MPKSYKFPHLADCFFCQSLHSQKFYENCIHNIWAFLPTDTQTNQDKDIASLVEKTQTKTDTLSQYYKYTSFQMPSNIQRAETTKTSPDIAYTLHV